MGDTKTDAILVPQRALSQGPQGPVVYVVDQDEKIQMRSVVASDWKKEQWLIDQGLKDGDRVVVNGTLKSAPGTPVKAVPWNPTSVPATESVSTISQS
jgi:membrane fusion protein (multidrug efflux system)